MFLTGYIYAVWGSIYPKWNTVNPYGVFTGHMGGITMEGMGVAAVGAYVRTLADLQRITYAEVAEAAGVQAKYIW